MRAEQEKITLDGLIGFSEQEKNAIGLANSIKHLRTVNDLITKRMMRAVFGWFCAQFAWKLLFLIGRGNVLAANLGGSANKTWIA